MKTKKAWNATRWAEMAGLKEAHCDAAHAHLEAANTLKKRKSEMWLHIRQAAIHNEEVRKFEEAGVSHV